MISPVALDSKVASTASVRVSSVHVSSLESSVASSPRDGNVQPATPKRRSKANQQGVLGKPDLAPHADYQAQNELQGTCQTHLDFTREDAGACRSRSGRPRRSVESSARFALGRERRAL